MKPKLNSKFDREDKEAAILGQVCLDKTPERIPTSRYNRYARLFGLPSMNHLSLVHFEEELNNQAKQKPEFGHAYQVLYDIYNHKMKLSDVVGTNETHEEFQRKLHTGYTTQAENHQLALDLNRHFNRKKRNEIRLTNQINSVFNYMFNHFKDIIKTPNFKPKWKASTNKTMIITAADLHIGATVSVHGIGIYNNYNIHIALERWQAYINKCLKLAKEFHIHDIKFICCGDLNESYYMRSTERDEAEVGISHQIPIVERLLVSTIKVLSKYYPVDVYMITGNHDRINGNLFDNKYGDTYTFFELNFLKELKKNGAFNKCVKIHTENADADEIHDLFLNIRGKNYLFIHGDTRIKQNKRNNIAPLQKNRRIDVLVYGHFHNYHAFSDSDNRMEYCLSSLEGWNTYSKRLRASSCAAGQVCFIAKQNRMPIAIPIDLSYIQK